MTHGRHVRDHEGQHREFRVHLKAPNGEIIATSQDYTTKNDATKSIEVIKTDANGANVEDHSG